MRACLANPMRAGSSETGRNLESYLLREGIGLSKRAHLGGTGRRLEDSLFPA